MKIDANQSNVVSILGNISRTLSPYKTNYGGAQLSLPFGDPNALVIVREADINKVGQFVEFAKKFRPACLLDVRLAPRLDFVAGSRALAFKVFDELNVEYIDVMGRLGVSSRADYRSISSLFGSSIASVIGNHRKFSGPMVLFFDDEDLLEKCRENLPSALRPYVPHCARLNVSVYKGGLLAM